MKNQRTYSAQAAAPTLHAAIVVRPRHFALHLRILEIPNRDSNVAVLSRIYIYIHIRTDEKDSIDAVQVAFRDTHR